MNLFRKMMKEILLKKESKLVDLSESYKHLREHGNTAFIFC